MQHSGCEHLYTYAYTMNCSFWAHTMLHIYYFYFTWENDQLGRLPPSEHTPVTLTSLRNRTCYLQILSLIPKRRQVHDFSKLYINEILYSWPLVLYIRIVALIHVIIWSSFILLTLSSSHWMNMTPFVCLLLIHVWTVCSLGLIKSRCFKCFRTGSLVHVYKHFYWISIYK